MLEVHPMANIVAAAKLVKKASPMLAAQLLYDMKEFKKTGKIELFGESHLG
jgi:hypothetical protein